MSLRIKNKKIACSFNDFSNIGFIEFIEKLSKENQITIFTNNPFAKHVFKKNTKIEILNEKKSYLYRILSFLALSKKCSLEKFYHIENILFNKNIFIRILFIFKSLLFFLNIGIDRNFLRKKFKKNNKKIKNFDILFTDFRFNEIYTNHDLNFTAKINQIPIYSFIFSWDNIFSGDVNLFADKYFASSRKLRNLIYDRHNIEKRKISLLPAFQFDYLKNKNRIKKKEKDYIFYVCCSEENTRAAEEEFEVINFIGKYLKEKKSELILKVRPYPYFSKKKIDFKKKIKFNNIKVMEYGKIIPRTFYNDMTVYMRYEKSLKKKYLLLFNSIANINFFSTIGIESVLLKKFTIFLNLKKNHRNLFQYLRSNNFKVKFLDHYKLLNGRKNYLHSYDALKIVLDEIINKKNKIKLDKYDYNFFKKTFTF